MDIIDDKNIDKILKIVESAQAKRELKNFKTNTGSQIEISELSMKKSLSEHAILKNAKLTRKKLSIAFIAGVLVGVLGTIGTKDFFYKVEKNLKVFIADSELKERAYAILLEFGLASSNEKGKITIENNKVSDYRCLDLTNASSLELHIYSEILGSEFNEAIQTASYDNGGYYYTGTNQWRRINGYIDKDTGVPSYAEQRAAMVDDLLKAYDNNFDGVIRTSEELFNNTAKGR